MSLKTKTLPPSHKGPQSGTAKAEALAIARRMILGADVCSAAIAEMLSSDAGSGATTADGRLAARLALSADALESLVDIGEAERSTKVGRVQFFRWTGLVVASVNA